ncbi:MAG: site-2 protease family protein [Deltaproteobacteria bacterium]|nr:site-2 protease family protein [Deltaproteobacteria bacterium]
MTTLLRRTIGVISILFFLVLPHELGHLIAAKLTGIGVMRFSVGFGPIVASTWLGNTEVCLSLLPLGGYVMLVDQGALAGWTNEQIVNLQLEQPNVWKMLITPERWLSHKSPGIQFIVALAGSCMNFLMVLASMPYLFSFARKGELTIESFELGEQKGRGLIGPIGIIKMASSACDKGFITAWMLAVRFSVGIGLLQLVPIPFFDGQHAFNALAVTLSSDLSFMEFATAILQIGIAILLTRLLYVAAIKKLRLLREFLNISPLHFNDMLRELTHSIFSRR